MFSYLITCPAFSHLPWGFTAHFKVLANADKHCPLPLSVRHRSPASQLPLSLLVRMEPGQASPVCLGQNAMAPAVLDLRDAWHESQQKTHARVMPGSPPADRGCGLKEGMFLGPKLSEPLKWGACQSQTNFFWRHLGTFTGTFGFHLFSYISTPNPCQFFHPMTSEEKVFWEINVNKLPRMLGRGSTVAYGMHSINGIYFPLTRVLFIKPDSINTWEFFLGI